MEENLQGYRFGELIGQGSFAKVYKGKRDDNN